jgi:predicted nucleic acid-binding protein
LLTDGILSEHLNEAVKPPQFQPLPALNQLSNNGRAIYFAENRLDRTSIELQEFPPEHRAFVADAMAARASYLITNRQPWLDLSPQTSRYGLQIVTPGRFMELEG